MAYFRKLATTLEEIYTLLNPQESWLILINADPDAIACAAALKALIRRKVKKVDIAHINKMSRPDNLEMVRSLRIPMSLYKTNMKKEYQRFAIVDSQPHHSPLFQDVNFDIVIDHHPIPLDGLYPAPVSLVIPEQASCATILTELLYNAKVPIGKRLATALQYGIRTDTGSFGRSSTELDLRAYHYLSKKADHGLLMQILRSEYLPAWLPYFAKAIETLTSCKKGNTCHIGKIKSPDILVVVADFFQKVHGLQWVAVSGEYEKKLVIVFRGDAKEDLGALAMKAFAHLGSAGGHPHMARAELPIKNAMQPYNEFIANALLGSCE